MNRTAVWALVLVAIVLIGLPPVFGTIEESRVSTRLELLNEGDFLSVDLRRFDRGWFGSTAVFDVGLSPQYIAQLEALPGAEARSRDLGLLSQRLSVLMDIAHGPVAFGNGVHLGWSYISARANPDDADNIELQQLLGTSNLFEFNGNVGFTGAVDFDLNIPPIAYAGELTEFASTQLSIGGRSAGLQLESSGGVETLSYSSGPLSYTLSGLSLNGDNERISKYFWLGELHVSADRLLVVNSLDPRTPLIDASNIGLSSRFDRAGDENLIAGTIRYTAESVLAGAGLELTGAELGVSIDNLDIAALDEYYRLAQQVTADPLNARQALEQMPPVVERLAAAGPSLALDPIRFSANNENFVASIRLNTDPSALPPFGIVNLQDPALWLGLLSGSANATVSKPLAELIAVQISRAQIAALGQPLEPEQMEAMAQAQAGFLLATLASQGMLQDNGDRYSANVLFMDGELNINGYPLPLGN